MWICNTEVQTCLDTVYWLHSSGYLRMDAEEEGWIKYFSCSLFLTRGGYETNIESITIETKKIKGDQEETINEQERSK